MSQCQVSRHPIHKLKHDASPRLLAKKWGKASFGRLGQLFSVRFHVALLDIPPPPQRIRTVCLDQSARWGENLRLRRTSRLMAESSPSHFAPRAFEVLTLDSPSQAGDVSHRFASAGLGIPLAQGHYVSFFWWFYPIHFWGRELEKLRTPDPDPIPLLK